MTALYVKPEPHQGERSDRRATFACPTKASTRIRQPSRLTQMPLPKAHFRVHLGTDEVGVESSTPLHWAGPGHGDPDLQQTVTLRRAIGSDRTFFKWREAVASGRQDVRDVTISQLSAPARKAVNKWLLKGATAVRWSGPDFHARSGEIAYEELELRYESIIWLTASHVAKGEEKR